MIAKEMFELGDTVTAKFTGTVADLYGDEVMIKDAGEVRWLKADLVTLVSKKPLQVGDKITPANVASVVRNTIIRGKFGWIAKKTEDRWQIVGSTGRYTDTDITAGTETFVIALPAVK